MLKYISSIKLKLSLILIILIVLFSAFFIFFTAKKARPALRRLIEGYGEKAVGLIAANAVSACKDGVFDVFELKRIIDGFCFTGKEKAIIEIYDRDLNCILRYMNGKELDLKDYDYIKGVTYEFPINTPNKSRNVIVGKVKVVYPIDAFFYRFVSQLKKAFFLGVLMVLLFSLLIYFFTNAIFIRPINKLTKSAVIIGNGNLDHEVPFMGNDEIGVFADIFAQMKERLKDTINEMEELNRCLEKRVEERTVALREAHEDLKKIQYELIQAGKMAAIGMIGAEVAHELNNPLCGVQGYADMLMKKIEALEIETDEKDKYKKYLSCISQETKRCSTIVSNLLSFSKKRKKELKKTVIARVVDSALLIMEYQIKKWNLFIDKSEIDEHAEISGNADQLQQVFINLISNAHDAMPDGGCISIKVFIENDKTIISFKDDGTGISDEKKNNLFNAFYSTKTNSGETNLGLGLSISKQIIDEHNGSIEIISAIGQGTEFRLTFPSFV